MKNDGERMTSVWRVAQQRKHMKEYALDISVYDVVLVQVLDSTQNWPILPLGKDLGQIQVNYFTHRTTLAASASVKRPFCAIRSKSSPPTARSNER